MNTFLQLVIAGFATGSLYGLVALGFLTIYHATGVVNFAQGDILMVGGVATYLSLSVERVGYALAIPAVLLAAAVVAVAFRYGLMEPLLRRRVAPYGLVLGTIAFGLTLQELAALVIGDDHFAVRPLLPNEPVTFGGVSVLPQTLIAVVASWAIVGCVWLFLNRTLTGKGLQAVGMNKVGAAVSGIRVSSLIAIGVLLSVVITCVAGFLLAPITGVDPRMGLSLAVKGFAAAVVGGFASVYRGMVAGVAIGMVEQLGSYYVSNVYAPVLAYVILILALVVQPRWLRLVRA